MYISRLVPRMTDNGKLTGSQLHSFATVMVFEPVVEGEPAPGNPLRISLLVNEQAAFAAVRLKRVMLAHNHFQLSVSIEVSNGNGMRGTDLVEDVHVEL